jgi:hypothetical protein
MIINEHLPVVMYRRDDDCWHAQYIQVTPYRRRVGVLRNVVVGLCALPIRRSSCPDVRRLHLQSCTHKRAICTASGARPALTWCPVQVQVQVQGPKQSQYNQRGRPARGDKSLHAACSCAPSISGPHSTEQRDR